jgi:hypothetical protein
MTWTEYLNAYVTEPWYIPMDCFTREIITRWTPLFFFSVKRLCCCIIVFPGLSPVRVTLSLFSTSYARPWFCESFLCCERKSCRRSILCPFRVYVIAGSNVKFSRQWTTEMGYPFSHFESLSNFQTRKQNSAVFFVYKNYKLHYLVSYFFPMGQNILDLCVKTSIFTLVCRD